jgi:hypothetical protein
MRRRRHVPGTFYFGYESFLMNDAGKPVIEAASSTRTKYESLSSMTTISGFGSSELSELADCSFVPSRPYRDARISTLTHFAAEKGIPSGAEF